MNHAHLILAVSALVFTATPVDAFDTGVVWNEVIEVNANEVDRLLREAEDAIGLGNQREATNAYAAAVDLAPDRLDALVLELDLRVNEQEWSTILERTEHLTAAITTEPDAIQALFFRAVALAATGEYEDGAELLERITRFRSDLTESNLYYGNLAELHMAAGNLENAIIFYRQALSAGGGPALQVGLAVALERAGRSDEALEHVLWALIGDSEADFLDEDGVFFVPEGDVYLYRALIELAEGDIDGAISALDAFGASPASADEEELIARLRDRTNHGGNSVSRHPVPNCTPSHLALHTSGEHIAVACEYSTVQEIDRNGPGSRSTTLLEGHYPPTRSDITYSPDGETIRVLQTNSTCLSYARESAVLRESSRVIYQDSSLIHQRFIGDGDRVLITGSGSGSFQSAAWDTMPLQSNLTHSGANVWFDSPQMSSDETVLATVLGTDVQLRRGPFWAPSSTVPLRRNLTYSLSYALSPSGDYLVTAYGTSLVRYLTATGQPTSFASLNDIAAEFTNDLAASVTALKAVDDTTYLVGTPGWVYVVRFE